MAKQVRVGLSVWDRLVLLVAWAVTCGLVYVLGFYVGRGTQEQRAGVDERIVRLPVTAPPPAAGQRPASESEFTFYDKLATADKGEKDDRREPPRPAEVTPSTLPPKANAAPPPAPPVVPAVRAATPPPAPVAPAEGSAPPPVVATPARTPPPAAAAVSPPVRTATPPPVAAAAPAHTAPPPMTATPPGTRATPPATLANHAPTAPPAVAPPAKPAAPPVDEYKAAMEARAAARATPPATGVGGWTVVADLTRDREQAEALERQLRGHGYDASVVRVARDGDTWYRVRVGRFSTSAQAEDTRQRLRDREGVTHVFVTSE